MKYLQIYKIDNIQKVYQRHSEFCGSVLYSEDHGYTWKSVPMDSGKWDIINWCFTFIELKN